MERRIEGPPETLTRALHRLKLLHGHHCPRPCFRPCPRPSKEWHHIPWFAMGSILGGCRGQCLCDYGLGYHYPYAVEDGRRRKKETREMVYKCLSGTPTDYIEGSVLCLRWRWSTTLGSRRCFDRDAGLRKGKPGTWVGYPFLRQKKLGNTSPHIGLYKMTGWLWLNLEKEKNAPANMQSTQHERRCLCWLVPNVT